ncbi:MAG: glutamate-1-semialdehyde 2,1-aminomutase, partial [Candidatus Eremiobacteraeota bacterium]|nr:glutamate-1-semialdehyde 2,1-aminomutase [Candidatus Eremiobacteraeota bacterium]
VDVDGNEYIDCVGSWGPMLLGHAHPKVMSSVAEVLTNGLSFGATCPHEIELARLITELMPAIEMVRLVNSGTESTMSAIRLARGYTGRSDIIKFEGCYHGHSDCLLAKAGSGAMTLALPDSAGVPAAVTQNTIILPFNDLDAVRRVFQEKGAQIAAIIVEPVAGNMGVVPPKPGYLEGLREITSEFESLLIFDEVMTCFRVARGGAQARFGIEPDLTCLGKVVGGGMPLAAYGGKRSIMQSIAPLGPVYQAGTLSGNPVATTAGRATLEILKAQPEIYDLLEERGAQLEEALQSAIARHRLKATVQRVGSMMTLFFAEGPIHDYADAKRCNTETYATYFQSMLAEGIYLAPSQFEAAFLGIAHGAAEMEQIIRAADKVLAGFS